MTYTDIKSEFVKSELKKTKFSRRGYIDDLMDIENFALGKCFGMWSGYRGKYLEEEYPKQWKKIHLELDPKGYKQSIELEKNEAKEEIDEWQKLEREELLELKRAKEAWKKMGGK